MNTFTVTVQNKEYIIHLKNEQEPISYEVLDGDVSWTISMNQKGVWEAETFVDANLLQIIGNAIEDYEA